MGCDLTQLDYLVTVFYTYVLEAVRDPARRYIGYTSDLKWHACMTRIGLMFGVISAIFCFGCAGIRDSRLEPRRQALAAIYRDQMRPMTERMTAFDELLDTFTSGTPESTLDRFVDWPVLCTKSRIDGYIRDDGVYVLGNTFQIHLNAPDGSDRWITMRGDRVH